jgi:hypothetical protein
MNLPLPFQPQPDTFMSQRWRDRRPRYKPPHETINPLHYEVAALADDAQPKAFVLAHHYAGTYPAARFRVGLFRAGRLVGVAIYSHPVNDRVLTSVFDAPASAAVELGRFVLLDDVPGNGESWFLVRSFELLRKADIVGVLSFSDPVPRRTAAGVLITPGHIGTIYQAANGCYLGRGTPRRLRMLANGQVLNDRALQKIRRGEQGWEYAAEQLLRAGASSPPPLDPGQRREWLHRSLGRVTSIVHHPGNHRYAWRLDRSCRLLRDPRAYPKPETSSR